MSCFSAALHGSGPFWSCSYNWARSSDIFPVLGGYISSALIFITFLATLWSSRSIKRSDNFIAFSTAFNEFMKERQALIDLAAHPPPGQTAFTPAELTLKAKDHFGRFYGFMFSEYYAYRGGTLARRPFTMWMLSRWREFKAAPTDAKYQLLGVSFKAGWEHWLERHYLGGDDHYSRLMKDIRDCRHPRHVWAIVLRHGRWLRYLLSFPYAGFYEGKYQLARRRRYFGRRIRRAVPVVRRWAAAQWRRVAAGFRYTFFEFPAVVGERFTRTRRSVWTKIRKAWRAIPRWLLIAAIVVLLLGLAGALYWRFH